MKSPFQSPYRYLNISILISKVNCSTPLPTQPQIGLAEQKRKIMPLHLFRCPTGVWSILESTGVYQEGLQVLLGKIKLTFTFLSAKSKNRELVWKIFLQCIMALTMNVPGWSPRGHWLIVSAKTSISIMNIPTSILTNRWDGILVNDIEYDYLLFTSFS